MRNFLNPRWLLIVNTLPIVVLFFLFSGQFNIIHSLLYENNIRLWVYFGLSLALLSVLNLAYTGFLILGKKKVSMIYSCLALFSYTLFLYLFYFNFNNFCPSNLPRWMISENLFLYAGTFIMPTLVYSLFVSVIHLTPETKEHNSLINFLLAISIPVLGYLFYLIILPLWRFPSDQFNTHVFLILVIVATLVFVFFLIKGIYILSTRKAKWQKYQLAWKIPIAIIFPIVGLILNNNEFRVFGDFSSIWFYTLAIVNGVLICLPDIRNTSYQLFLFVGRIVLFPYTFYFFLIFLPFLPLSVIAIIAFGVGFLMLTPLVLFIIHVNEIVKNYTYLKLVFHQKQILVFFVISVLVIPTWITISYLKDKFVINEALNYVYTPDFSKHYSVNKKSLQNTLAIVKQNKASKDIVSLGILPYLSSYYNWLVLDNLTLSEIKINTIENIFFGTHTLNRSVFNDIQNDSVIIQNISTTSNYDKSQEVWRSWIDLKIVNKNSFQAEYATTFKLPEGCWISDYYLYVDDRREAGMLAEKKSAMWVFSKIRNERRDPGILYYLTGNNVAFRIFPFSEYEVRNTGIEFIHKEPLTLTIDGHSIKLGDDGENVVNNQIIEIGDVAYIPSSQKQYLKSVQRKPYFHFLVDVSENQDRNSEDLIKRIDSISEKYQFLIENAQISFVNTYVNTFPLNRNWKENYRMQLFEGGFYLDRAIKTTLFNSYQKDSYPIIVVVSDSIEYAVWEKDFSDFKFTFPESKLFFVLDGNGKLSPRSLEENPMDPLFVDMSTYEFDQDVLEYRFSDNTIAYLPNNNQASIALKKSIFKINKTDIKEKDWQSALCMQGSWMSQTLHPEKSDKEWLNLIKYSFSSKIMTPLTSYLVVENEAQKAALRKKQEQILSGNKSLDPDEDTRRMDEPGLWLLVALSGFIIILYRKKRKAYS